MDMEIRTTYDLIRQLAKLDPTGNMRIMLAVKYVKPSPESNNEVTAEASGFIDGLTLEHWEDGEPMCIVLESTDM